MRIVLTVLALCLVVPTPAMPIWQAQRDQDEALRMMKQGKILSFSRIREIVASRIGGTVVGEKLRRTNKGWIYEVRVRQAQGSVIFAILDAKTGRILNQYGSP